MLLQKIDFYKWACKVSCCNKFTHTDSAHNFNRVIKFSNLNKSMPKTAKQQIKGYDETIF
jgi:hypothetical protein